MYSYDRFVRSRWSLVIVAEGRIIFRSRASAIRPLVRFLKLDSAPGRELTIYDKYVGRAAALLMVLSKPQAIYTPVISEGGKEVLRKYRIPFKAQQHVKYLMGMASDEMCRWEKMTIGKTPEEFWGMLS